MNRRPDTLETLRRAKTILLVDWPDQSVPRKLINAGFTVFGFSPNGYASAKLVADPKADERHFPPRKAEHGYLVFERLDDSPLEVDIVNVFRPEEELEKIIQQQVIPLKAKTLWLHPPLTSPQAGLTASEHGIAFIEGADISACADKI